MLHGGATNSIDTAVNDSKTAAIQKVVGRLAEKKMMSALDIVETAVSYLEDEEELNAGWGSVVQMDGRIRMDAGICDSHGQYGAVIQIEHVKNPIQVARKILDYGYHTILSGDGAQQFAREQGIPAYSVFSEKKVKEYLAIRQDMHSFDYETLLQKKKNVIADKLSTVGAVAIDNQGNLAAACSTGGTNYIYPGRVGDTPIFGAGLYCSKYVAVACTGEGDKFLRSLVAKAVEEFYLQDKNISNAVDSALQKVLKDHNGYGGLIAMTENGDSYYGHTTKFMAQASL